jgi:hypothetical protein
VVKLNKQKQIYDTILEDEEAFLNKEEEEEEVDAGFQRKLSIVSVIWTFSGLSVAVFTLS